MVKFTLLALLVACTSSSTTSGNAASINACDLLTNAEILQVTGAAMGSGLLQTTDTQSSCEWNPIDDNAATAGLGITVADFDASLWDTLASSQYAIPVMGIGEKAFKNFPHGGDLSVKQGAYEIDVGVIDFKDDPATVDANALSLMMIGLSRI